MHIPFELAHSQVRAVVAEAEAVQPVFDPYVGNCLASTWARSSLDRSQSLGLLIFPMGEVGHKLSTCRSPSEAHAVCFHRAVLTAGAFRSPQTSRRSTGPPDHDIRTTCLRRVLSRSPSTRRPSSKLSRPRTTPSTQAGPGSRVRPLPPHR